MATDRLKCPECDRTFGMAAHLARHLSAGHDKKTATQQKTAKRVGRKASRKAGARGPGRPKGSGRKKVAAKALGRPRGAAARLGLKDMSFEQLNSVILAARAEAYRRIEEYRDAIA